MEQQQVTTPASPPPKHIYQSHQHYKMIDRKVRDFGKLVATTPRDPEGFWFHLYAIEGVDTFIVAQMRAPTKHYVCYFEPITDVRRLSEFSWNYL